MLRIRINILINQDEIKCQCEFKNGNVDNNGIKCDKDGTDVKIGSCYSDKWCTGSVEYDYSSRKSTLCEKGVKK